MKTILRIQGFPSDANDTSGFTLVEFLIATTILLVITLPLFSALNEIQQAASRQAEVQQIMDNLRVALQAVTRCIRQSGNDPYQTGFDAISVMGTSEVRIRSDLTGSKAPGKPNRGDPDGDITDSSEDILIRYNKLKKRIEMVSAKGAVQIIADEISDFSLQYMDSEGNPVVNGRQVRIIRVKISGKGSGKILPVNTQFGIQLIETVGILS